jgi:hypothetical protein
MHRMVDTGLVRVANGRGVGTRMAMGEGEEGEGEAEAGGLTEETPTAVELTRSVIERTVRDAPLCFALTIVAGVWAQALNLGGTFVLALFQLHVVPVVAALFSLSVALWKFSCAYFVRTSVLRGAEDGAGFEAFDFKANLSRASLRRAWESLKESRDKFKTMLALDARRVLSIAWNSLITVPIPYLGLIRLLDFAVAGPVLVLENKTSAEAMKRSQELMYGYRVLLMKTAFLCSTVAAALLVGVIGLFMLAVPTLPSVLLPPVTPGVPTTVGEVASGFINGSAFDRVWVVGSPLERTATIALLICGLVLSFLFTLGFRELVHLFYTETKARYVPQPPPDPTEKKPLLSRLQFWKKDKP